MALSFLAPSRLTTTSSGTNNNNLTGVIGCLQATEALKVLGEFGSPLVGRLCTYDGQDGSFYTVRLRPRYVGCCCARKPPWVKR